MKIQPPKSEAVKFIYQERQIYFLINPTDENVMVNATEMASMYGRLPKDFLKTDSTQKLIECFCRDENFIKIFGECKDNIPYDERKNIIFYSTQRGKNAGTWMHEILALEFAAWLDPNFKFWMLSTIKEILFGKYNIHRKKTVEIEKVKSAIIVLENKILSKNDADVIELLAKQKELKQLRKEKTNAIVQQTKIIQLDLFK